MRLLVALFHKVWVAPFLEQFDHRHHRFHVDIFLTMLCKIYRYVAHMSNSPSLFVEGTSFAHQVTVGQVHIVDWPYCVMSKIPGQVPLNVFAVLWLFFCARVKFLIKMTELAWLVALVRLNILRHFWVPDC